MQKSHVGHTLKATRRAQETLHTDSDGKPNRSEVSTGPLDVSLERLVHEMNAYVGQAADIDDALSRCRKCLKDLEQEHPNAARSCMVKCALVQQLRQLEVSATLTQTQRSSQSELLERLKLPVLTVELVHRLPEDGLDAVLSVAAQQAVHGRFQDEDQGLLLDLCQKMQEGGGQRGLFVARSLLHHLDGVRQGAAGYGPDREPKSRDQYQRVESALLHEAWVRTEGLMCQALAKQAAVSCGASDLLSAAQRVGLNRKTKGTDFDWSQQQDVLAALKAQARQHGLLFNWDSMTFEALNIDGPGPLAAALHAQVILTRMGFDGTHPLLNELQRFVKERAKPADPKALIGALAVLQTFAPQVLSSADGLLDCFDVHALLSSEVVGKALDGLLNGREESQLSKEEVAALGKLAGLMLRAGKEEDKLYTLLLLCVEHTDARDVLMPSRGSAIDRMADLAHRLSMRPAFMDVLRNRLKGMTTPAAMRWMALLGFAQFYVDDSHKPLRLAGRSKDQDVSLFLADIKNAVFAAAVGVRNSPAYAVWTELVRFFWMSSVVNGQALPSTGLMLRGGLPTAESDVGIVFDRTKYDSLLPLLNESSRATLDDKGQKDLLRQHVIRTAIEEPELFAQIVKAPVGAEKLTDDELRDVTLSVEAVLLKECERLKVFTQQHGHGVPAGLSTWLELVYIGMVRLWAAVAKAHPGWLDAVSSTHPWLRTAITMVADLGDNTIGNDRHRQIARVLTQAAVERNAKA